MEDLWRSEDIIQEQKCTLGFNKARDVFSRLFDWLDRDKDAFITAEDMIWGISRIMIRDVVGSEITNVFNNYGTGDFRRKLTKDGFLLAIANGMLDGTFKDTQYKETFIK
jgi:hypothetical protein